MRRFMVVLITFMFPVGIWFMLLGYEFESLLLLLSGWTAIVILAESESDG